MPAVVGRSRRSRWARPASRVRIALTQPVAHRVRSDRNTVVVDFEQAVGRSAPYVLPPRAATAAAPDAMLALAERRAPVDPIAALGLDCRRGDRPARARRAGVARAVRADARAAPRQAPPRSAAAARRRRRRRADAADRLSSRAARGAASSPGIRSASISRARICAPCCARSAEISGLNIVIDPAVQGTVDVALRDVPWDQALDIILRANKLGYLVDGTIVRIAPLTVLAEEEAQRRKLAEEQALAGELRVLTKTLSYAKAEELQALLTKSALSQRGTVQVDARTNTLIITDLRDRLTTRQRADRDARPRAAAGRDRGAHRPDEQELRARARRPVGLQRPRRSGARQHDEPRVPEQRQPRRPDRRRQGTGGARRSRPPSTSPRRRRPSAVGLALGSVNGAFNLDVALSALEKQRQRPPPVDAARHDAEQRRRRNHAGRADSDSDRRQQHRDASASRTRR